MSCLSQPLLVAESHPYHGGRRCATQHLPCSGTCFARALLLVARARRAAPTGEPIRLLGGGALNAWALGTRGFTDATAGP